MNQNRLNNRNSRIERKYGIQNGAKRFKLKMRYGIFRDVTTNPEANYPD